MSYSVDGDTVADCLGIIERAAQRVRAGKSAVIGSASSAKSSKVHTRLRKSKGKHKGKVIPFELRREIELLLRNGRSMGDVARMTGQTYGRVNWIAETSGLLPRRSLAA